MSKQKTHRRHTKLEIALDEADAFDASPEGIGGELLVTPRVAVEIVRNSAFAAGIR